MPHGWTKQRALQELGRLTAAIDQLTKGRRLSADHTRWMAKVLAFLEEVFGQDSRYFLTFASLAWAQTGSFIVGGPGAPEESMNPQAAVERRHHQAYLRDLEVARGLLLAAADHLKRTDLSAVYQGRDTPPEASAIVRIINLAQHKLRKVIHSVPGDESDLQDAFESLLVGADIAYSRETERIEYSSKTYAPDFVVPKIGLAIEVKFCNQERREKEIIGEINDDILAYRTKYANLLFAVYDLGKIRDVDRFKASLESHENVVVVVIKH